VPREQVLLYAIVFASGPERCLEIGVKHGGGSRIIHAALTDLGRGRLIGLDPAPDLKFDWAEIADRASLLVGKSPDDLGRAADLAGGPFDFVFLDGDHCASGVDRDFEGLAAVTRPGAMILCHDAYYEGVSAGIANAIARGLPFQDRGLLARTPHPLVHETLNTLDTWGGMRLLERTEHGRPAAPAPQTLRSRVASMLGRALKPGSP
jgi:predicted O-methyltransferase YrrM